MSTIGGLLLPQLPPVDYGRAMNQGLLGGSQMVQGQTQLLELAELRRQQEEAAAARQFMQQYPDLVLQGGMPTSTLGSLAPTGGPPGGAPMTQQAFGPGGVGPTQVVPGGQDLSRFATQGTPTSTLASLGPQPQPPAHPQQRLLELARTNPEAALAVQKQMQQAQDAALRREEQRLTMGTKVMEYVGRLAQGVTDQAPLDAARQELARIHPQAAAQLPQTYSKEAMAPFIAKANSVLENQTLGLSDLKSQRDAISAQHKLIWEQQQHGERMGLEREKLGQQQTQQQQTQQQQTRGAEFQLQGEYNKLALPYREVRDAMGRIAAAGTSPTAAGDAALLTAYMKMLDPTTGVRNEEIRNAENVGGLPQRARGWLEWLKGGAPLQESVRKDFMDRATTLYEQYQKDYEQVGTQYREQATRQGLDPRNVVQDYRSTIPAGGRTAGKPVGEMSRDELLAERDRLRKGGS